MTGSFSKKNYLNFSLAWQNRNSIISIHAESRFSMVWNEQLTSCLAANPSPSADTEKSEKAARPLSKAWAQSSLSRKSTQFVLFKLGEFSNPNETVNPTQHGRLPRTNNRGRSGYCGRVHHVYRQPKRHHEETHGQNEKRSGSCEYGTQVIIFRKNWLGKFWF